MKQRIRLLCLTLLTLVSSTIHAEGVAKIGETEYETLQAAITSIVTGDKKEITILQDISLSENIQMTGSKTVQINLNGHQVTNSGYFLVMNGTSFYIVDKSVGVSLSVNDDNTVSYTGGVLKASYIYSYPQSQVILYSGKIESSVFVRGYWDNPNDSKKYTARFSLRGGFLENTSAYAVSVWGNKAECNVYSGVIYSGSVAIMGNGTINSTYDYSGTQIKIEGGMVIGKLGTIYNPNDGIVTMSGGTLIGTNGLGILMRAGQLDISGGTIKALGTADVQIGDAKRNSPSSAVVYDAETTYPGLSNGTPSIVLSGGTFIADKANAVTIQNSTDGNLLLDENIAVTGGLYSDDKIDSKYLKEGFTLEQNGDGMYGEKYYAQIGETKYKTLQDAINAAPEKTETLITLLADVTDGSGIAISDQTKNRNIVIDFDGHTYTMAKDGVGSAGYNAQAMHFDSGNTLTLKNGTFKVAEGSPITQVMQNYCNLTIEDFTVDAANVVGGRYKENAYTGVYEFWNGVKIPIFNFNNGTCVIKGSSKILIGDNENIYVHKGQANNYPDGSSLTIEAKDGNAPYVGGNLLRFDENDSQTFTGSGKIAISAGSFKNIFQDEYCAEGFIPVKNDDGTYSPKQASETDLVLVDGEIYPLSKQTQVKTAKYTRAFSDTQKDKYQAWYVPFDYTLTEEDIAKADFYRILLISASPIEEDIVEDETKVYIHLTKLEAAATMKGNRPYIIQPKEAGEYSFATTEATTLLAPTTDSRLHTETAVATFDFYGTYSTTQPTTAHELMWMAGGQICWNATTTGKLGAYRWYLKPIAKDGDAYANVSISFTEDDDAEVTGIDTTNPINTTAPTTIYSVNGVRQSQLHKGLNIVKQADGTTQKVFIP